MNKSTRQSKGKYFSQIISIVCVVLPGMISAQTFGPREITPFGISDADELIPKRVFVDIDDDGDLDLFSRSFGGEFLYQENIGDETTPSFGSLNTNPFGLIPITFIHVPHLVDIDGDDDFDILLTNTVGVPYLYENGGTASSPSFEEGIALPFGLSSFPSMLMTDIVDIDGDGDYDIFYNNYNEDFGTNTISYAQNIGTETLPSFAPVVDSPFGLTPFSSVVFHFVDFADLDDDGDMDLMRTITFENEVYYHQNVGTTTEPGFSSGEGVENPFGIEGTEALFSSSFADIDDDGDLDLFISGDLGLALFHENLSLVCSATVSLEVTEDNCFGDNEANINVLVEGGTSPYAYDIGDGSVSSSLFEDLSPGEYTITITDASECSYEETITIDTPDELEISSTVITETLGNDGSIDITVSGGVPTYTYAWEGPDEFTSTDEDLNELIGGTYTLTIIDANGCTITTAIEVSSTAFLSEEGLGLSIYPNPSVNGVFTIENKGNILFSIKVIDLTGRIILSDPQSMNGNQYKVDLSGYDDGIYIIQIDLLNNTQIMRVVKEGN